MYISLFVCLSSSSSVYTQAQLYPSLNPQHQLKSLKSNPVVCFYVHRNIIFPVLSFYLHMCIAIQKSRWITVLHQSSHIHRLICLHWPTLLKANIYALIWQCVNVLHSVITCLQHFIPVKSQSGKNRSPPLTHKDAEAIPSVYYPYETQKPPSCFARLQRNEQTTLVSISKQWSRPTIPLPKYARILKL